VRIRVNVSMHVVLSIHRVFISISIASDPNLKPEPVPNVRIRNTKLVCCSAIRGIFGSDTTCMASGDHSKNAAS
jgi:hypothetical protein